MSRSDAFGLPRALALLLLLALLLPARPGLARPPREIAVSASGHCPAGDRVQRQLVPLLVETRIFVGEPDSAEVVRSSTKARSSG